MENSNATVHNSLGQPIGWALDYQLAAVPGQESISGRFCRLERLDSERHGPELHEAFVAADDDADWTYLPYGPFPDQSEFLVWLQGVETGADPMFYTIIDTATGRCSGLASYLRVDPTSGSVEVGHIHLARCLQRTPAATEAMFLLMQQAFESGYRRYEWKCDDLNAPSKSAARRLGFQPEGVFRQATHYKGRNRDTAWFSILDNEWPNLRAEFTRWLDPANFDTDGQQRSSLRCRA